jgi:hypothetical protein
VTDVIRDFERMRDYIVGRMSDDERSAFEDRLVREPELVRELEQSVRMREGLQQLRTQGSFHKAASRGTGFRIWLPALVAAAGAGVALFLWVHRSAEDSGVLMASLESGTAANTKPFVAAHLTFVSVRGGSTPDVELSSAGPIEIRAAPATRMAVARYRVTLVRQGQGGTSESVGAVAGLAVSADGYVHCYADASRLAPGNYVLRVDPDARTPGMVEVFPFNLRARAAGPSP